MRNNGLQDIEYPFGEYAASKVERIKYKNQLEVNKNVDMENKKQHMKSRWTDVNHTDTRYPKYAYNNAGYEYSWPSNSGENVDNNSYLTQKQYDYNTNNNSNNKNVYQQQQQQQPQQQQMYNYNNYNSPQQQNQVQEEKKSSRPIYFTAPGSNKKSANEPVYLPNSNGAFSPMTTPSNFNSPPGGFPSMGGQMPGAIGPMVVGPPQQSPPMMGGPAMYNGGMMSQYSTGGQTSGGQFNNPGMYWQ